MTSAVETSAPGTTALASVGVVGGGAWGTALALAAARAGRSVTLWARDAAVVEAINGRSENPAHLPGVRLEPALAATADLARAAAADLVVLSTPAQTTRELAGALAPLMRPATPLLITAKGFEAGTGLLLADVVAQAAPAAVPAVLSGPSFAADVARSLPTAVTVAAADIALAEAVARALASPSFRPYASDDVTGVEVGGALKNVLAIASGIVIGRGLGASAQAALIARAFAELTRLAVALGGRAETLTGLSGFGDLVLTATSRQSRNFTFGVALGEGGSATALSDRGPLVEGAKTAPVALAMARRLGIDAPVTAAVAALVEGRAGVDQVIGELLARPLKRETA